MSRRIVAFSSKMYFSVAQSDTWLAAVAEGAAALASDVDVVFCLSYLNLPGAIATYRDSGLLFGAQNGSWLDSGALTGEVSPKQLAEIGCTWLELGHAERERHFGERPAETGVKASAAIRNGLTPLVCIGEKERTTIAGAVDQCREKIDAVLSDAPTKAPVVFAYEPVWAIGAQQAAEPEYVRDVLAALTELWGDRQQTTRVVYGGAAQRGTYTQLADQAAGLFLGRFAHDPAAYLDIAKEIATA
jgi:triosephosphate isomerase